MTVLAGVVCFEDEATHEGAFAVVPVVRELLQDCEELKPMANNFIECEAIGGGGRGVGGELIY